MSEIYWLTRLDALSTFLMVMTIFGIVYIFVCIIVILSGAADWDSYGNLRDTPLYQWVEKNFLKTIWIPTLITILSIFTPTTKEALIIYGVGGSIDYLKTNDVAKQLPDKCINALDAWVESLNEEKNENK